VVLLIATIARSRPGQATEPTMVVAPAVAA
jgi:hypothetical protein